MAVSAAVRAVLPRRNGDVGEFIAHGNAFRVKRSRGRVYTLWVSTGGRCRFGDRNEIAADVGYAMQYGVLPPAHPNRIA